MEKLTCARAAELLCYDPNSGHLTWKERGRAEFTRDRLWRTWNKRWAGRRVGSVSVNGYRHFSIDGHHLNIHRVIWLMMTGEYPAYDVDHINGERDDNRWENLRAASRSDNAKNCKRRADNVSGVTGVFWDRSRQLWTSTIRSDGKDHHLGRFVDFEVACAARIAANAKFGFHPNHGRHP